MISDRLKFVMVHINRTGGNSRERVLGRYGRAFGCNGGGRDGGRRHDMVCDLYGLLGESVWGSFFSFAFVRNPWDRMVSLWHYRRRSYKRSRSRCASLPFKEWLFKEDVSDGTFGEQLQWLELDGSVIVDFVGRFERFEVDWGVVCDRIGVSYSLPHSNRSRNAGNADYYGYYDSESRDFVASLCERDIELFGYSF